MLSDNHGPSSHIRSHVVPRLEPDYGRPDLIRPAPVQLACGFSAGCGFLLSQQCHNFASEFHCALESAGRHSHDFLEEAGHSC